MKEWVDMSSAEQVVDSGLDDEERLWLLVDYTLVLDERITKMEKEIKDLRDFIRELRT